jgi:hypothetical protein
MLDGKNKLIAVGAFDATKGFVHPRVVIAAEES